MPPQPLPSPLPAPGGPPLAAALALTAALVPVAGTAEERPTRPPLPLWEAGVVLTGVSQPAYPGADDRVGRALPLPYLIYRGPLLRAEQDQVGLRALRTPRFELNLGVNAALGSSSDDIEARRGMPDLGTLIEVGPRLVWNLVDAPAGEPARWRFDLPLRAVLDVSSGWRYQGLSLAPEVVHERRLPNAWRVGARFGPVYGSADLADMFYGVNARYATPQRPAYTARAGLIAWRLGAGIALDVTPDLRLFAFARLDTLAGAANADSPLVRRDAGASGGVGLAWTFARSSRPATE